MDDQRILASQDGDLRAEVDRIASEFLAGFETIAHIDRPAVAIFGSARVSEDSPEYASARDVARRFAEHGWPSSPAAGPA